MKKIILGCLGVTLLLSSCALGWKAIRSIETKDGFNKSSFTAV
jgi:hypothetical protein